MKGSRRPYLTLKGEELMFDGSRNDWKFTPKLSAGRLACHRTLSVSAFFFFFFFFAVHTSLYRTSSWVCTPQEICTKLESIHQDAHDCDSYHKRILPLLLSISHAGQDLLYVLQELPPPPRGSRGGTLLPPLLTLPSLSLFFLRTYHTLRTAGP